MLELQSDYFLVAQVGWRELAAMLLSKLIGFAYTYIFNVGGNHD